MTQLDPIKAAPTLQLGQPIPTVYRAFAATDEGFIYHSWLRSHRKASAFARDIPHSIYFSNHKRIIAKLLTTPGVGILLAANQDSPDQIFGYVVFQQNTSGISTVHYIYVKAPYRKFGIGTNMIAMVRDVTNHDKDLPMLVSHATDAFAALKDRWNIVYNPYLLGELI